MAAVPGPLIWEMVKKNNSFLVKEFGRGTASVQFSRESNNLYNLNSYKHSGMLISCLSVRFPGNLVIDPENVHFICVFYLFILKC
jgi:hypothetical protein